MRHGNSVRSTTPPTKHRSSGTKFHFLVPLRQPSIRARVVRLHCGAAVPGAELQCRGIDAGWRQSHSSVWWTGSEFGTTERRQTRG